MSERALALSIGALCAVYLSWVAWSAAAALHPKITTQGLSRVYHPPRALPPSRDTLLDPRAQSLSDELSWRYQLSLSLQEPEGEPRGLNSARQELKRRGARASLGSLNEQSELPCLVELRGQAGPELHLLIARYAGEWVRFDPAQGVLLGPLPSGWLGQPTLTSELMREGRW